MLITRRTTFRVAPQFQPLFRQIGLDADAVFHHELIRPWRTLSDRENCTLDFTPPDRDALRWHVKRYPPARFDLATTMAEREVAGYRALNQSGIPTATLVGWGTLSDGRSFVITEDLADYDACDKLIREGSISFDRLLEPTADLAAKLHQSGLHHRDLYLCHFFAKDSEGKIDVRLIDVARVRSLPNILTRRRWVVKDLAQFWFSMTEIDAISEAQRDTWLNRYAAQRGLDASIFKPAVVRKGDWIARHDEKLRQLQPNRNISIPET